jgi:hypothetical protein
MTPAEAAAALFETIPPPVSVHQLQDYGIDVDEARARQLSRELLSLNLYWILAAIEAHISQKYRAAIVELLLNSVRTHWGESGELGLTAWQDYLSELQERRTHYGRLMDAVLSPMALNAEAATVVEDQGIVPSEDRQKLFALLIDSVPVDQYAKLLDDVG